MLRNLGKGTRVKLSFLRQVASPLGKSQYR
jgi:hypothetical protein